MTPDLGFCGCDEGADPTKHHDRMFRVRIQPRCRVHMAMAFENDPGRRCPDCGGLHLEAKGWSRP